MERSYAVPLLLMTAILLLLGLVPGLSDALQGSWRNSAASVLNPYVINITAGGVKFQQRLPWLTHSGIIVFWIACATPYMIAYSKPSPTSFSGTSMEAGIVDKVPSKRRLHAGAKKVVQAVRHAKAWSHSIPKHRIRVLKQAAKEALEDVVPVIVSIAAFSSLARLMANFEMTSALADVLRGILSGAPGVYAIIGPVLGFFGTALTGSTTTANFLFGRLQITTARSLGLLNDATGKNTLWEFAAVNILGASTGEIISPMNSVVITMMDNINISEAALVRRLIPIATLWMIAVWAITAAFVLPGRDGLN